MKFFSGQVKYWLVKYNKIIAQQALLEENVFNESCISSFIFFLALQRLSQTRFWIYWYIGRNFFEICKNIPFSPIRWEFCYFITNFSLIVKKLFLKAASKSIFWALCLLIAGQVFNKSIPKKLHFFSSNLIFDIFNPVRKKILFFFLHPWSLYRQHKQQTDSKL